MSAPVPRPAARLEGLKPYPAPRPDPGTPVRLDGSEGGAPAGPLLDDETDGLVGVAHEYPDPEALTDALAARAGIAPDRIVLGAGADEILDRCCRAYLEPGRRLLLPVPTFAMIPHYARLAGATIEEIPWPDDAFPRAEVLRRAGDDVGMVACVSPNNPTGAVVTPDDLRALAEAMPAALIVVDHAYIEYAAEHDLTAAARPCRNVLVARTFSKAWGLAGCRVGWGEADPEVVERLRTAGGPYPVSAVSLRIAHRRLRTGVAEVAAHVARVREHRDRLTRALLRGGLSPFPSRANYVLAEAGPRAEFLTDALARAGIRVRRFGGELASCLRFRVPDDPEVLDRLEGVLARALAPEALLFDLDGVLADVSESQRACIRETARSFGAETTDADVTRTVLAGDANDDWEVTRRLVTEAGIETTYDEVVERYQARYLGGREPGLRERETLIPPRATLERLAARRPLGIVTGRPRDEAEWFLDRFAVRDLFRVVITADDAPRKPDPAPVRAALTSLGATRAWMIGDTPDDVVAARDAHVLPIGVVSPADDPADAEDRLRSAGAVTLLQRWEDLETWLS